MSSNKKEEVLDKAGVPEIQIVTLGLWNVASEQTPLKEKEVPHPPHPLETLSLASPAKIDQKKHNDHEEIKGTPKGADPELDESIRDNAQEVIASIQNDDNQSHSAEQNEQSNISKSSSSSKKKDQAKSESNDERKSELPTSRKCFNKMCSSKKIFKKIRSRVEENKYRFFCKSCYENYFNNLYCEFCEQIYSNNCENEDDDKWIGCDHCERWNHIECEKRNRDKNINELKDKNLLYECLVCSQKNKTEKVKKVEKEATEEKVATKQKIQINRDQRTSIFHKKNENFPNLEYFLQNYSFRLWMNESQIRQDLEHLRSVCLRTPQEDNIKNRFKKIKTE